MGRADVTDYRRAYSRRVAGGRRGPRNCRLARVDGLSKKGSTARPLAHPNAAGFAARRARRSRAGRPVGDLAQRRTAMAAAGWSTVSKALDLITRVRACAGDAVSVGTGSWSPSSSWRHQGGACAGASPRGRVAGDGGGRQGNELSGIFSEQGAILGVPRRTAAFSSWRSRTGPDIGLVRPSRCAPRRPADDPTPRGRSWRSSP